MSIGRLRDWWTNTTVAAFEERAQCVAKQYSKYYVLDPNGKKVLVNGNVSHQPPTGLGPKLISGSNP
jgi:endothelin-converting enzyme